LPVALKKLKGPDLLDMGNLLRSAKMSFGGAKNRVRYPFSAIEMARNFGAVTAGKSGVKWRGSLTLGCQPALYFFGGLVIVFRFPFCGASK
jgi:hypothetical protein